MPQGQPTTWLHEPGVAGRDGDGRSCGNQRPPTARSQHEILGGHQVGTGTDVAMEASDITLISGDLKGVPTAIQLSRRTVRTI